MTGEEKLIAYEAMQAAVEREYKRICAKMEDLKAQGKSKTVTYRQLMGQKVQYKNMIEMYELYDLKVQESE